MKYPIPFYESAKSEYLSDTDPVRKTFRLAILVELFIKFHTAVVVQNFLKSRDIKVEGKTYLSRGLSRPSLGLWAFITEIIYPLIEKKDLYWGDFPEYFITLLKPVSAELIPFRNALHHGPTPGLSTCVTYQEKIFPLIESLERGGILGRERLVVGEFLAGSTTREIELVSDEGRILNLTPLLYYRDTSGEDITESRKYYFYNDTRKTKDRTVNLLNYEVGLRETKDISAEFRKIYPLEDWSILQFARFQTRIDELTENFQGRTKELGEIQNFLKNGVGTFFVFGGPGMGKSSLLAKAITLTLSSMEKGTDYSEEKFELGENIGVCDYFIRQNTNTSYAPTFFQMVGDDLEHIFSTGISVGNNLDEMKEKWRTRLIKIESKLKENTKENANILKNKKDEKLKPTKLVIFLDGIDEGEIDIIKSIPSRAFEGIIFLCTARDHVRQSLSHIDARMELFLGGLLPEEIAGLLRSLTLATFLSDTFLQAVVQKSGGSPLYLKLLSDVVLRGELQAGDLSRLPGEVNSFYAEILGRMKQHTSGEKILETLFILTIARDFLTVDTIAYFLGTDRNTVEDYLSTAKEVLCIYPITGERLNYQLFHESLRHYIKDIYSPELKVLRDKYIVPGVQNWEEIHKLGMDLYTDEYLLSYGVTHLLEDSKTKKEAEKLVLNSEYIEAQLKILNFYMIPLNDATSVLKSIILELGGRVGETKPLGEILVPGTDPLEPYRTTRLVQLVNHTGELSYRASKDIGIALKWIEQGKVSEALERMCPIQDRQRLLDSYLLALRLLTLQPDGEENRSGLKLVLEDLEKQIPNEKMHLVRWHDRYTISFFAEICQTILEREQEIKYLFNMGEDREKKNVVLHWMGYVKIGPVFKQTNFEKKKVFILKFSLKIIRIARIIFDSSYRCDTFSRIGESISKLNNVEIGKSLFPELVKAACEIESKKEKIFILSSLGESISKLGDLELGRTLFPVLIKEAREMRSLKDQIITLSSIGKSISNLGILDLGKSLISMLLSLIDGVEDTEDYSTSLGSIGESISRLGDMNLAKRVYPVLIELANAVESSKDRRIVLHSLGESLLKMGNIDLLNSSLQKSLEIARAMEDPDLRSITLCNIGKLRSLQGDFESGKSLIREAVEVVRGMGEFDNRSETLSNIAESVLKLGDIEFGKSIFPELVHLANDMGEFDNLSETISNLADSISEFCELELGKKILPALVELSRRIEDVEDRNYAIKSIGDSVSKMGDMDLGKVIFPKLVELSRENVDIEDRSNALRSVGESVSRLGDREIGMSLLQEALELAREIENSQVKTDALRRIGESVSRLGDLEFGKSILQEAVKSAREIKSSNNLSTSLSKIGELLSELGDVELGMSLFPGLVDLARGIENFDDRCSTLSSIGESVSNFENLELGRRIFPILMEVARGIGSDFYRRETLGNLGESAWKLGDIDSGKNLFIGEVEVFNEFKVNRFRSVALNRLGESVSKKGDVELWNSLFPLLSRATHEIEEPYSRCNSLCSLGESVSRLGYLEDGKSLLLEAVEVANNIKDFHFRNNAFLNLGVSASKLGYQELGKSLIKDALIIAYGFEDYDDSSYILNSIEISEYDSGYFEFGDSLSKNSLELAGEPIYDPIIALIKLVESECKMGNMKLSKSILNEAIDKASKIEDSTYRTNALQKIAESLLKIGEFEFFKLFITQILELGYQLKDKDERKDVLQIISKTIASFGSNFAYTFFETNHEFRPDIPEVVKAYTEEYRKIKWEEPDSQVLLPYYIRSFGWVPYDWEFAKISTYDVISTLARLGNVEEALEAARGIGIIPEAG